MGESYKYYFVMVICSFVRGNVMYILSKLISKKGMQIAAFPKEILGVLVMVFTFTVLNCCFVILLSLEAGSEKSLLMCASIVISLVLTDYFMLYMMERFNYLVQKQYEDAMYREEMHYKDIYYEEAEKQNKEVQKLKHDMKHKLHELYHLVENSDGQELSEKIGAMCMEFEQIDEKQYSDNPIVDSVLRIKFGRAKARGIKVETSIRIPKQMQLDHGDMSNLCVEGDEHMFRIAICDDERQFRKRIHDILIEYMNENDILYEIDEFESGKDFISLGINLAKYDIVFLDVNMDELDGMETAQKIRKVSNDVFIVFVTAFITCAPQGYSVGAIRYILKNNVNFPELIFECMDAISLNMNYVAQKKKFNFNEGTKIVALERLLYIESRLHKLEFYIMEDKLKKYSIYGKLDELEKELQGNDFIRIHQSYLVNMKHIEKVSRYEALLNNGIKLEIPKARYKFVEETFVSYKGEL